MYRVSVKIEVLPVTIRRTPSTEENTPELLVQAKGRTAEAAMEKALRIISTEMAAVTTDKLITTRSPFLDDDENED